MKKISFGVGVLLKLAAAGILLFPASAASAKGAFQVLENGEVSIDGQRFADMGEYVTSDYFRRNGMRCGTRTPEILPDDRAARSVKDCTLAMTKIQSEYWLCDAVYTIPVWFHVIYRSDGEGNIPASAINAQLNVLNQDFRAKANTPGADGFDTRIQFTLAGITRTMNDTWFNDEDNAGYTSALNRDPDRYVNIYTNTAGGYLGYAIFPQQGAGLSVDGIVMNYQTVGGRNNGYLIYDQGRTLVHEMGHYLGLLHTFDGNACSNSYTTGDLVKDTPAENTEHYACTQTTTCGSSDPIHNYMNYTPDSCMTEFTREQANRLVCSLVNYRPSLFQVSTEEGGVCSSSVVPSLLPLLLRN
ncbi:MAG: hypothetical protein Kow0089_16540 [Desulfobulbaceae bacterium]